MSSLPPYGSARPVGVASPGAVYVPQLTARADTTTSPFTQLRAALSKNWQVKMQSKCGTCVETLLPVAFVIGLVLIWTATKDTNIDAAQFLKSDGAINATSISNFMRLACVNTSNPNYTRSLPFFPCLPPAPPLRTVSA